VHGVYDQFVTLLRAAGLVDGKNNWIGRKTHLVQTGDVPDRGPGTRKVLDLLMQLEKQASRGGGMVHALIGNHEAMNMYGDLRYTTPEEFSSFRDADSEKVREHFYEKHLEELAADPARAGEAKPDNAYRKAWEEKHPLGYFEHRFQFGPNGEYGKWIAAHNTIIQIDDTIFVHGGISPKYADISAETINDKIRQELRDFSLLKGGIATDAEGPLWYRGLAKDDEAALSEHVETYLKMHDAKRMVIGHTPTAGAIIPRFGGRVLLIDVGLSSAFGARQACLVIEAGKVFALHRGKLLEIPSEPGAPLLNYLKSAAALDPSPSPLLELIGELQGRAEQQQSLPAQ